MADQKEPTELEQAEALLKTYVMSSSGRITALQSMAKVNELVRQLQQMVNDKWFDN